MKIHIETERLILRDIRKTDVDGMFALDSNAEVHKYLGNKPITTKEKAAEIIQFIQKQYEELGIGRFAVIEKETGAFTGWSGLKLNTGEKEELNGIQDFVDVGYRFIPRFWGKGYATESALATLDYGFNVKNYQTIYGAAETANGASNHILQKIGLQFVNDFEYDKIPCKWYKLDKTNYGN